MRLDTFKLLGAAPMAINFGELYSALQQGVVDGQENPYAIIYSNAFNEVQKYLSKTGHIWGSAILCVNSNIWSQISDEDKATVKQLAQKWGEAQRKETIQEEDRVPEKARRERNACQRSRQGRLPAGRPAWCGRAMKRRSAKS